MIVLAQYYNFSFMKSSAYSLRKSLNKKFNSRAQSRNKVALPKISKTVFHSQQKSLPMQISYLERIQWVLKENDYSGVATQQINQQYNKLRQQLLYLNEEVIKALTKIQNKPIRLKTIEKDNDKVLQLLERQIQNNNVILEMNHKQFHLISKRADQVSQNNSKYDIEQQILKTKQKMQKIRLRIKQLKKKNNQIGNSIVNTDDLFEQIKHLEVQKQNMMRKKMKLEEKIKIAQENLIGTINKISNISNSFDVAQQYFHKQNSKEHTQQEVKKQEQNYNQKKHLLEINKKNMEATIHLKQQKYHQILKFYEQAIDKQQSITNKINESQIEAVNLKNIIIELEEKLKILNLEKDELDRQQRLRKAEQSQKASFFTEINQETSGKASANTSVKRYRTDIKKKINNSIDNDKIISQKKNSARVTPSNETDNQAQKWAKITHKNPSFSKIEMEDTQIIPTQQKIISQENIGNQNKIETQGIISEQKIQTDVKISEEKIKSEQKIQMYSNDQEDQVDEQKLQAISNKKIQLRAQIPKKTTQQSADDDLDQFQKEVSSIQGKKSLREKFSVDLGAINQSISSMKIKKEIDDNQLILDD